MEVWPWVCTWIVLGEGWGERQEQEESVFTEDCSSEVGPRMHRSFTLNGSVCLALGKMVDSVEMTSGSLSLRNIISICR